MRKPSPAKPPAPALPSVASSGVSVAWGGPRGNLRLLAPLSAGRMALSPTPALLGGRAGDGRAAHLCTPRPLVQSFIEFTKAAGTPVPLASPPRLVVSGFYRHVRNPIYAGFLAILTGEVLLFGSPGLLEYTAVAWCIGAAAVRFYEEPTLARKFGAEYRQGHALAEGLKVQGGPVLTCRRPPGTESARCGPGSSY